MTKNAELLTEAGVFYTFNEDSSICNQRFFYTRKHVGGQTGQSVVWCRNRADFLTLLARWNEKQPCTWAYWAE